MYPDFQYLFQALLGHDMPSWLGIFKTFGFFVALSFLAAARAMTSELKRKEAAGFLKPVLKKMKVKAKPTSENPNPVEEERMVLVPIHMLMTEIVFAAAIGGIIGAKFFNAFESWDDFNFASLLSPSGLTFYGGFIVATAVLAFYARRYKIPFRHLCDAAAPAIMLAYGVGRLGCQFSGDGDWGIYNSAYITQADASLRASTPEDSKLIADYTRFIPSKSFPAPAGVPRWMVAMNYPHNVACEGRVVPEWSRPYNTVLPVAVFPTPIYEALLGISLFGLMWAIRKKLKYPLHMFAMYLIFAGTERFFVELIRVNAKYDFGFVKPTQAELISVILVITGVGILLFYRKKETPEPPAHHSFE